MTLARPATRYELYLCALATLVSGPEQTETVQRVFRDLFGGLAARRPAGAGRAGSARPGAPAARGRPAGRGGPGRPGPPGHRRRRQADAADGPTGRRARRTRHGTAGEPRNQARGPAGDRPPALASRAERLAGKDFAELTPAELATWPA